MKLDTRRISYISLGVSLALVLSYVEFLLPPVTSAIPGVKLGLPNLVIIYFLFKKGIGDAAIISFVRIVLSALLFGNVVSMLFSISGAVLSIVSMELIRKIGKFSSMGVSSIGGVMHNLGQILVAIWITDTSALMYYMIVLTVTGTVAGLLIGIAAGLLVKKVNIR